MFGWLFDLVEDMKWRHKYGVSRSNVSRLGMRLARAASAYPDVSDQIYIDKSKLIRQADMSMASGAKYEKYCAKGLTWRNI